MDDQSAKLINRKSLGEEAAAIIRDRIIEGYYSFGERLIEEDLANEFNISRFSIRDGLKILEAEDLTVRERNRLTKVAEFDKKKIEDIYDIRSAIELLSVDSLVKNNIIPVNELEKNIDQFIICKNKVMDNSEDNDDLRTINKLDIGFHTILIRSANNQYSMKMWNTIENLMLALYTRIVKTDFKKYIGRTEKEHKKILYSLCKKNCDETKALLLRHIRDNVEALLDHIN